MAGRKIYSTVERVSVFLQGKLELVDHISLSCSVKQECHSLLSSCTVLFKTQYVLGKCVLGCNKDSGNVHYPHQYARLNKGGWFILILSSASKVTSWSILRHCADYIRQAQCMLCFPNKWHSCAVAFVWHCWLWSCFVNLITVCLTFRHNNHSWHFWNI